MGRSRDRSGFSLIEILIALAILGVAGGVVMVQFGGFTQGERLRTAARELAGMSDFVASKSASAQATCFFEIDFDRNRYRFRIDPPQDPYGRFIDLESQEILTPDQLVEFKESFDWASLPHGVHFARLWISSDKYYDKKVVEVEYQATGSRSSFILWIRGEGSGDDKGTWLSVVVNGLTGRSEVLEGAVEFANASESDFQDVMAADQAGGTPK